MPMQVHIFILHVFVTDQIAILTRDEHDGHQQLQKRVFVIVSMVRCVQGYACSIELWKNCVVILKYHISGLTKLWLASHMRLFETMHVAL